MEVPVIAIYHDPDSFYGYRIEIEGRRIEDPRRFALLMEFPHRTVSSGTGPSDHNRSWEHPYYELETYLPNEPQIFEELE